MKLLSAYVQRNFLLPLPGAKQLFYGNAGVQLLGLLAFPLLQFLYLPEDFGRLGLLSSLAMTLGVIGTLRLDLAIVLARDNAADLARISASLLTVSTLLLCAAVVGWLFLPVSFQEHLWFIPWLPLAVFSLGLANIATQYLTHLRNFSHISRLRLQQKLATLITQVVLGFLLAHWWGLTAGFMFGLIVAALYGIRYLPKSKGELSHWRKMLGQYRDIIQWGLPQTILDVVSSKLPFLLLPFLFSYREAGWYAVAFMILSLPESVIGASIGQAFYKQFVDLSAPKEQWALLRQIWQKLAVQGLVIFGGAAFFIIILLGFTPAGTWTGAAESSLLLVPFFFLSYIVLPGSRALTVFRKQQLVLYFGIVSMIFRPAMLILGWWLGSYYLSLLYWSLFEIVQLSVYLRLVAIIARRRCLNS